MILFLIIFDLSFEGIFEIKIQEQELNERLEKNYNKFKITLNQSPIQIQNNHSNV